MALMLRLGLGGGASISAVHKAVLASRSLAAKPHAGETQYVLYFSVLKCQWDHVKSTRLGLILWRALARGKNLGDAKENEPIDGIVAASWRLHVTRKEMWL
jgi:hypothetical protein